MVLSMPPTNALNPSVSRGVSGTAAMWAGSSESMLHSLDNHAAAYIHITAVSIAAYDYIMTLPAEWRFYKNQRPWGLSPGCILFILIRYLSLVVLVVNTVGFFSHFSPEMCSRYYLVGPIFKVLQTMVSQIILGIRMGSEGLGDSHGEKVALVCLTLNIARRSSWVMWLLAIAFVAISAAEWFTNLYDRSYAQNAYYNCTGAENVRHGLTWLYYVVAMSYDIVTLTISTYYLLRFTPPSGRMTHLVKLMLYDGIGYFMILTATNIFNLILYRTSDILTQSSGACLGEAVTWIMSQRILIHLRDAAAEHHRTTHVISRPLHSRSVSRAMRSHFELQTKNRLDHEFGSGGDRRSLTDLMHDLSDVELDVHVQVEHSVTVEDGEDEDMGEAHRPTRMVWTGKAPAEVKV